jgi:hypothetical protein
MTAGLRFLPWVRDGLAGEIAPGTAQNAPRATVPVSLELRRTGEDGDGTGRSAPVPVTLLGPGDVTGIDAAQIIRSFPAPGSTDAEDTGFAAVEFARSDLPWQFTPGAPDGRGRLRPWLVLVVVRAGTAELGVPPEGLPRLTCPRAELPDLARSWAWAHAQVLVGSESEDPGEVLAGHPGRALSRLLSPRRLESGTAYLAAVVPAFEAGVRTGLGRPLGEHEDGPPVDAWSGTAGSVELPVYHHWYFTAGPDGDFETLARRLTGRPAVGVGFRELDLSAAGVLDAGPGEPAHSVALPSLLRSPGALPEWPRKDAWRAAMRELMNHQDRLTPPVHAGLQAPAGSPRWLDTLNTDPRYRAVAGVGARIVAEHQEHLVAAVWEQVARFQEANRVLRQAQLARDASTALYEKRIAGPGAALRPAAAGGADTVAGGPDPTAAGVNGEGAAAGPATAVNGPRPLSDEALLGLTSRVHGALSAAPALRSAPTVSDLLAARPAVAAAAGPEFRRAARTPASAGGRSGADADAAVRALAANEITPAPPAALPPGGVPEGALRDPSGSPFRLEFFDPHLIATADPWWRAPGPVAPGPWEFDGAAPAWTAPVVADDGRAFVLGGGSLYELAYGPAGRIWRNHGPAGAGGSRVESAIAGGGTRIFLSSDNWQGPSQVVERRREGDRWRWIGHAPAPGAAPCTHLAAAGNSVWAVIGGALWELKLDSGHWFPHGAPDAGPFAVMGRPAPMADGTSVMVVMAVMGLGFLHERRLHRGVWEWRTVQRTGPPATLSFLPHTTVPVRYGSDVVRLVEGQHELSGPRALDAWEYNRSTEQWRTLGRPAGGTIAALCAPEHPSYQFAVLDDGRIARADGLTSGQTGWSVRDGNPAARGRALLAQYPGDQNRVFVVTPDGGLALSGHGGAWTDYGQPKDPSGQGPLEGGAPADRWRFAPRIGLNASMVVATLDQPGPACAVRLRVGADLGYDGAPRSPWTPQAPEKQSPPFHAGANGLGAALADLSGNGRPDLIVFTVEPGPAGREGVYRIGRDLAPDGTVTGGWSPRFVLPDSMPDVTACDIAVADLDRDGRPELIVGYASAGQVSYRVGWGLAADGSVGRGWGLTQGVEQVPAGPVHALGIAAADTVGDDDRIDLVVATAERVGAQDRLTYRVGREVNRRGLVRGGWTGPGTVGGTGPLTHQGLGVAIADFTGSRRPDLVVFRLESHHEEDRAVVRVGFDLDADGQPDWWGRDFTVPAWGDWSSGGAAVAVADLDPALVARRDAVGNRFVAAARRHQEAVASFQRLTHKAAVDPLPVAAVADTVRTALDPRRTVTSRTHGLLGLAPGQLPPGTDGLGALVAEVGFPAPAYGLLREAAEDHVLAGAERIPPDTVTVLEADPAVMEAFLAGLNGELGRELLWRGLPVDRTATYFRTFWESADGAAPGPDIPPIHEWTSGELGTHAGASGAPGDGMLVLLLRGELLRRHPGTPVTLRRAEWTDGTRTARRLAEPPEEVLPRYTGDIGDGIRLFAFPRTAAQALGDSLDAGWYFTFREQPSALRFGIDDGGAEPADPQNSAHYALACLQQPVLLALHARELIDTKANTT